MKGFTNIPIDIKALETRIKKTKKQMAGLKGSGITSASIYWKPDKHGTKTIMQLIHKGTTFGKSRHEYIGKNKKKQLAAKKKVERYQRYERLKKILKADMEKVHTAKKMLSELIELLGSNLNV